jgi:HD superfamily phosphohydrolase
METEEYYDPLYGKVTLPKVLTDLLTQGVVLRLQKIGLMNYRSIAKLSLTSISRLEHSIGTAILTAEMAKNNSSLRINYNEYLCAALYHDINCASFGHAVEWAISRYVSYDHVEKTGWFDNDESAIKVDKPIVAGGNQSEFISKSIQREYKIDAKKVRDLIQGQYSCVINSKSMDLDNIDNVSRMALYMGLDFERSLPLNLANSLTLSSDSKVFAISADRVCLVEDWMNLRKTVYSKFIYSKDYFGYEFMVFSLIASLYKYGGTQILNNIRFMTDDDLLHYALQTTSKESKETASRMRLYQLPDCVAVISTTQYSAINAIKEESLYLKLKSLVEEGAIKRGIKLSNKDFEIHTTTDNTKTSRAVELFVDGKLVKLGEDIRKVLFGIILVSCGASEIHSSLASVLRRAVETLFGNAEVEKNFVESKNLSLFDE